MIRPTREYMAEEHMGWKLFKRVPYGYRFKWEANGPRTFCLLDEYNQWKANGVWRYELRRTVRNWFDHHGGGKNWQ